MNVLIKGMDMPKGCGECTLFDDECFGLYKCYRASSWGSDTVRASDCPLVEIPTPHGRLIDADELKQKMIKYGFKAPDMTVTEFIEDELTAIIEAEAK